MRQRGMTLFEIVVSLGIVVIAFVVVLSAIPVGMRLQEKARFQLYASAKAIDLITSFNTIAPHDRGLEGQSIDGPWDVQAAYRPTVFDLEQRLGNQVNGLAPVPLAIAQRLDSDNDEIQALLAAGGKLYYPTPNATDSLSSTQSVRLPPDEARRMVIGIIGEAQSNQIPSFPGRVWPLYSSFPAPTTTSTGKASSWEFLDRKPDPANPAARWDDLPKDADFRVVDGALNLENDPIWQVQMTNLDNQVWAPPFDRNKSPVGFPNRGGANWYSPLGGDHSAATLTRDRARRYLALALWYADRKSLDPNWRNGQRATAGELEVLLADTDQRARWSTAIRLLASAGMALTRHYTQADLAAGKVTLKPYTIHLPLNAPGDGTLAPASAVVVTYDMIRNWHENCMDVAMAYAARLPYDWGQYRPYNRAIFSDAPLLEWDMFGPRYSGTIFNSARSAKNYTDILTTLGTREAVQDVGTAVRQAEQYRVITPEVVRNASCPGIAESTRSLTLPILATDALRTDGLAKAQEAATRCTLTAKFNPSERCRQLVFWSVDWQSYEDFESAPCAPIDASRYVLLGARDYYASSGWNSRMTIPIGDSEDGSNIERPSFRNPERKSLFLKPTPPLAPGSSIFFDNFIFGEEAFNRYAEGWGGAGYDLVPDTRAPLEPPYVITDRVKDYGSPGYIFSGLFGADRNGNKHFDRGLRPASQRLRATTIARFIVYDPRLPMLLR